MSQWLGVSRWLPPGASARKGVWVGETEPGEATGEECTPVIPLPSTFLQDVQNMKVTWFIQERAKHPSVEGRLT